jgi:HPt (histidine-containing phosphotransfer) domain-containing protein
MPEDRQSLLDIGFDYILTKPFKEHELIGQIGISPVTGKVNGLEKKPSGNLHILREMTMGDEELFNSVLNQFLLETDEDVTALEENMKFLDVKKIRERVHKLAGRIGQVGAGKISERLRTIEEDIAEGKNINELADRIFSSITEVQKLVEDIRSEISV